MIVSSINEVIKNARADVSLEVKELSQKTFSVSGFKLDVGYVLNILRMENGEKKYCYQTKIYKYQPDTTFYLILSEQLVLEVLGDNIYIFEDNLPSTTKFIVEVFQAY